MTDYPLNQFIPVLPMRSSVLFPGISLPVRIGRAKSVAALKAAKDGLVLVVSQKEESEKEPSAENLHRIGTLARLEKVRESDDNTFQVLIRGLDRASIVEFVEETAEGYISARSGPLYDVKDTDEETSKALGES